MPDTDTAVMKAFALNCSLRPSGSDQESSQEHRPHPDV